MKKNRIIHYDLKPENILVYKIGNGIVLKICDMEDTKKIILKDEV